MSKRRQGGRRPAGGSRRDHIKDAQLCAQVARTLSYTLAELPDDALLDLSLIEVVPAPDTSRLAVRLAAPDDAPFDELRARLVAELARMRADIAAAINRKKVPALVFELVPASHVARPDEP